MQFSRSNRRKLARLVGDGQEQYPHSLQFYLQPPTESISLAEFESLAVDRLRLLKVVENLGVTYVKGTENYNKKLEVELRKLKFPFKALTEDDHDARRKDHISHFILRLAYCQSEDLRRWFIQQEMDLFRYRFNQLSVQLTERFLEYANLAYDAIDTTEKQKIAEELRNSTPGFGGVKVEECVYYKVPFCDAVDLVRVRRVYFHGGYAYVPQQDIVAIVLNDYRTKLSKALALTARSLPVVQTDERLQPLLSHLSHAYVGPDYSLQKSTGKISLGQIDALSVKSFPPCMRQLHKALRDNHHLRHGGRMQYGLFLKGIGLTLEQALQFWKSEFIRGKVDADKFDKGYAYSIRHSYGKEGKRTDYTPFSCMKIILSNPPGQGDYHGCPFRHSDPELLKQKLQSYKVSPTGISQILDLVKGMHYQLACQKYFALTHDVDDTGFSLNHPNQYFAESQQLLNGAKEIKKEQRQSENSQPKYGSQKNTNISTTPAPLDTTEGMELDGLEDYFAED
ncbi:DNA primase large subunit isoform X1 [Hemicordylus capensis]|uniref:DNA primase large subunit isoform X1 n=1 Tax=Hemicordylus capensis TaxID=884348 RepID=UPI00230462FE|nr:DNA primase large subunit isoform X1 [Hemicordylus capensis]